MLRYKKLHTLWLGKKAKKNLACLKDAENIKSLALRGIKLNDFEFLKKMNLEELKLLWSSNNDLGTLKDLKKLKNLKKIILDNTGINIADLNKEIQKITTCY